MEALDRIFGDGNGLADLRIAIVGIGNDLNGDDAAGVLVARAIIAYLRQSREAGAVEAGAAAHGEIEGGERSLVIDAGPAPESFTGPLRRFAPHVVVLIDAAEMHELPGVVRVFDWPEALGMSASTHTMPPSMLARFLAHELGSSVFLIGVQPAGLIFDEPVSSEVQQTVDSLSAYFIERIA